MPDEFVSFATWFAEGEPEAQTPPEEVLLEPPAVETVFERDEAAEAISSALRFRAALADALDVSVVDLLRAIAIDVVVRELRLAPADIRGIVERARDRYGFDEPVAIRVNPNDKSALDDVPLTVMCDPSLRRGDVMIDVATGTIDASLGARLDRIIAQLSAR